MKFGYRCKCGWVLTRGKKTRVDYALAKQNHALGLANPSDKPCRYLAAELARTQRDSDLKSQLLTAAQRKEQGQ